MRYNIRIQLEEDDSSDLYATNITRECGEHEIADELIGAAHAAAERVLRALPESESIRKIG